jgi:hypothetical protein
MESPFNQKAEDDLFSAGIIEDANNAMWRLAWHKYRKITLTILLLSLPLFFVHPFFPVLIFVPYIAYLGKLSQGYFMRQFAITNDFSYTKMASIKTVRGRVYKFGHSRELSHVVFGLYKNYPMRLFNYVCVVGYGKSKKSYRFTVCEFEFEKTIFPHILLLSKTMSRFGPADESGEVRDIEIPLEPVFADKYRLYATDGYEIEVMQIFTKEVLTLLLELGAHFSIEFSDNRVNIYDDLLISKRTKLQDLLNVAKRLLEAVGPISNRLHDDFAVLHPYYKDKEVF